MGNKKNPQPKTVRTVRDLARLAEEIGVQPSVLIWLEGLTLADVEWVQEAVRSTDGRPAQ